jgi:hypothetical protein
MCAGYNQGAVQTTSPWLIFCHDDIEILKSGHSLAREWDEWDVLGVCGTNRLIAPNWYDSDPNHLLGSVIAPVGTTGNVEHQIFGLTMQGIMPAQALDGIFIGCRREVWEALKFDESLTGFTGYDIDFSYRAYLGGYRVGVITDLFLFHASQVSEFGAAKMREWQESQQFLRTKFNFRGGGDNYIKHATIQYGTVREFLDNGLT